MVAGNGHTVEETWPRVLLCDDDPGDLERMEGLLGRHGFRVTTARSVPEATRLLEEYRFAAVVSDFRFPLGEQDGLDLLRAAKRAQPKACRALVSVDPLGITLAELVGAKFISKDTDYAIALVDALRECLDGLRGPK